MQTVDIGIQGVIRRDFGNVGMIGLFVGAEIKADGPISGRGNVVKDELESMPFGITPGVLIGKFYPSPCVFF